MSWQLLVLTSVLLNSVSVLLQRFLLKNEKSDPVAFSILFQLGVAIVIGTLVLLIQGKITFPTDSNLLLSLVLMTASYGLANIFIFKSLKTTEASRYTVIFSLKTFFTILASTMVFKEGLNLSQWFGAILIILGVIIVSFRRVNKGLNRGDLYAFVAAILFGIANTNDRFLVKFFDPYSYVTYGFLLPGLLISVINPTKIKLIKDFLYPSYLYKIGILCLVYGMSAVTFFAALQHTTNSSQIFTINSFGAIVTVILSIIFLKERDFLPQKLVGAVISLIGLLLVR